MASTCVLMASTCVRMVSMYVLIVSTLYWWFLCNDCKYMCTDGKYLCTDGKYMCTSTYPVVLTEAWERSMVSKISDMTDDIWMTSPLIRHSFLLSSRTVFMFSIQTASMGPSNTTHFLSGVSVEAKSRNVFAVTPSDHWNHSYQVDCIHLFESVIIKLDTVKYDV